jgi:hypothetical protein
MGEKRKIRSALELIFGNKAKVVFPRVMLLVGMLGIFFLLGFCLRFNIKNWMSWTPAGTVDVNVDLKK